MEIATFEAQCGTCGSKFNYPQLSDFSYGEFIFMGENGKVFGHFVAAGNPVWEFVAAILAMRESIKDDEIDIGNRIRAACAHIADPIQGQNLTDEEVCPVCGSKEWSWWGGERTGSVDIPEVTFNNFLSLSEPERRRLVRELAEKRQA